MPNPAKDCFRQFSPWPLSRKRQATRSDPRTEVARSLHGSNSWTSRSGFLDWYSLLASLPLFQRRLLISAGRSPFEAGPGFIPPPPVRNAPRGVPHFHLPIPYLFSPFRPRPPPRAKKCCAPPGEEIPVKG